MVRTFAFNPSTQSFGDTLPGSGFMTKKGGVNAQFIVPEAHHITSYLSNYNHPTNTSVSRTMPKASLDSSSNYSTSDTSNSTGLSPPPRRSKVEQPAMIVEDASTLFAIRSLLINGQRFYQPIDMKSDELHTSLKRHLKSGATNHHLPLRQTSSAEHLDNGPAKAALVAMRMAEEKNRQEIQHRMSSYEHADRQQNEQHQIFNNSNTFSAANNSKEFLANNNMMGEDLPWARGNPQPKSGKRGSPAWQAGRQQQHAPPSFHSENHACSATSQHLPLNLSNSYGSFYSDVSTHASFQPAPNLAQFANNVDQRKKSEMEQHNYELQKQIEDNKRRKYLEKQREWEQEERERIRNEIYAQRQRSEVEAEQRRATEKALMAERKAERLAAAQRATIEFISKEKQTSGTQRAPLTEHKRSLSPSPRYGSPAEDENKLEWWEKKGSWNDRNNSPAVPALRANKDEPNNNDENFLSNNADEYTEHRSISRRKMDSASSSKSVNNHTASPTKRYEMVSEYLLKRPESRPIRPTARSQFHTRSSRLSYQSSIEASANNRPDSRIRSSSRESRLETTQARLSATQKNLEHENSCVRNAVQKNEYGHHLFD